MTRRIAAIAATVLVIVLTGCAPAGEPGEAPEPGGPTGSPASPSPERQPEGGIVDAEKTYPMPDRANAAWAALTTDEQQEGCEALGIVYGCPVKYDECAWTEFAPEGDSDQVAGDKLQIAVDQGPREYATGEPVLDAAGTPVAYRVASGDIPEFIAERFCMTTSYLNAINSVRRAELAGRLYEGDTLNFDATTILTVGDQNGVVSNGSPPSPMPPQR